MRTQDQRAFHFSKQCSTSFSKAKIKEASEETPFGMVVSAAGTAGELSCVLPSIGHPVVRATNAFRISKTATHRCFRRRHGRVSPRLILLAHRRSDRRLDSQLSSS